MNRRTENIVPAMLHSPADPEEGGFSIHHPIPDPTTQNIPPVPMILDRPADPDEAWLLIRDRVLDLDPSFLTSMLHMAYVADPIIRINIDFEMQTMANKERKEEQEAARRQLDHHMQQLRSATEATDVLRIAQM